MIILTLFLAACSFAMCILLTPLFRNFALRFHYVDKPDLERKSHAVAVPRIGGMPVVLAHAASVGALLLIADGGHGASEQLIRVLRAMLPAGALVFFVGLLDDLFGLKPNHKLAGQIMAAALACWAGLYKEGAEGIFAGNAWGLMAMMVWLVATSNAFNLIDGADGVASGIGFFAALTMAGAGILYGDPNLVLAMAPLAGALLGFLRFNFNPASIFLGDCGSLWIGFVLGGYGVVWSQEAGTSLGALAPVMALSVPLLDMTLAVARRFISGKAIFTADAGHIHHRLLNRGFTVRRVALALYAATALAGVSSLLLSATGTGEAAIVLAAFLAAGCAGIRYVRYPEFGIAARLLFEGSVRRQVQSEISLSRYEQMLRASRSPDECWRVVQALAQEFGFTHELLRIGGRNYQKPLSRTRDQHWVLRIPLSDSEFVNLTHQMKPSPIPVARVADVLQTALAAKAAEFSCDLKEPVAVTGAGYGLRS
jgi:UDP-GlcNAc:undecaprenyl-phosphate GlcNAc-1-phosphate transferase